MESDTMNKPKVLAVDDNEDALFALEKMLTHNGFDVRTVTSGEGALDELSSYPADIVLLDVMMPGMDGFEVTKRIKADSEHKYIPVILVTAKDSLEDVTHGLNIGADDYVKKPFKQDELVARLKAALRMKKLYTDLKQSTKENQNLRKEVGERFSFSNIIGKSPVMQQVYDLLEKVKDANVPVLISGESGTGKELVARALHYGGFRKAKAFVAQNCSAFNENLLESELFGHSKGAFSGAISDKQGLFEVADGGTFFLDEVGEMSPALQAKLLRVLQDGTFIPVGSTKEKKVDVRVVAATHRDLKQMISEGKFREDLYYRLNVVNVKLPPLRERREDIPLLVTHYLAQSVKTNKKETKILTDDALVAILNYAWPGNVRQLANEIERLVIMAGNTAKITADLLSPDIQQKGAAPVKPGVVGGPKLKEAMEALEKDMILMVLEKTKGNKSEAARELGISRSNLIAKIQGYGIESE